MTLTVRVVRQYVAVEGELLESEASRILGEDLGFRNGRGEIPIRLLSDFTIFEPGRRKEMVSLSEMDKSNRAFAAAGEIRPFTANDEDAGQEDDFENDGDTTRFMLGTIIATSIDYTNENE